MDRRYFKLEITGQNPVYLSIDVRKLHNDIRVNESIVIHNCLRLELIDHEDKFNIRDVIEVDSLQFHEETLFKHIIIDDSMEEVNRIADQLKTLKEKPNPGLTLYQLTKKLNLIVRTLK